MADLAVASMYNQNMPLDVADEALRTPIPEADRTSRAGTPDSASKPASPSPRYLPDYVQYAKPDEDLDWTKVSDQKTRKKLQTLLHSRKRQQMTRDGRDAKGKGRIAS
ncbi:hypothetical protein LTR86_001858 [Recurvomyces mirabilis]|nr:hypothetical protein LTR86_001858 [Recurvomyces mirabilis]